MGLTAGGAVGLSMALDRLLAEPPARVHPVVAVGAVVERLDRDWPAPTLAGVCIALLVPLAAAGLAGAATALAADLHTLLGAAIAGLLLFAVTSLRMLLGAVARVTTAAETDPEAARDAALALVGRDTTDLSAGELHSAAIESAAENLADGLVAPLLAFAFGAQLSLAVGVAAAVWIKAVNTLDSMLGYPDRPLGRASARLDDVAMWLPARVTALLLAVAGRSPGALLRARRSAGAPASPNAGWPMATLAAVLDVRLSKPGHYELNAEAALPDAGDAGAARGVVGTAGLLAFLLAAVGAVGPTAAVAVVADVAAIDPAPLDATGVHPWS